MIRFQNDTVAEFFGQRSPDGWQVVPAKRFCREIDQRSSTGEEELLGLSKATGVRRKSDMDQRASEAEDYAGYKRVTKGDLISNKMQAWNGMFGISPYDGITSPDYAIYRLKNTVNHRFIEYVCKTDLYAKEFHAKSRGMGTGFLRLNQSEFLSTPFILPDLATQRRIADFLDRETARIDLLIEKKQRLATVLQEKLSATISNAVRGYLTSYDAPRRRDIEWFDSYPEQWTRMPLKALGNGHRSVFIDGDWIESTDLADEGIRYLTTGNVGLGTYKEQGAGFISTETFARLKCTEVFPGDILISRLNPPIGRACIVPDLGTRIVTSVDNVIVRPGDHVDRQYIVHLLTSREHFENTGNIARGTTMQRISRSALGKIRIPLPPLAEQREISRHLGSEVEWQQSLSERISCSIDRLKEYRSALITAAVTGQIDVTTYAKSGTPDRRLDAIQEEMGA